MTSEGPQQHGRQQQRHSHDTTSAENDIVCKSTAEDDVTSSSPVLRHRNWVRITDKLQTGRGVSGVGDSAGSSTSHKFITATHNSLHDAAPRFRVATYNILSDRCIKPGEYLYCPPQLRYMSSRHERIIAEIRNMQPHVVCFQVSVHPRFC